MNDFIKSLQAFRDKHPSANIIHSLEGRVFATFAGTVLQVTPESVYLGMHTPKDPSPETVEVLKDLFELYLTAMTIKEETPLQKDLSARVPSAPYTDTRQHSPLEYGP